VLQRVYYLSTAAILMGIGYVAIISKHELSEVSLYLSQEYKTNTKQKSIGIDDKIDGISNTSLRTEELGLEELELEGLELPKRIYSVIGLESSGTQFVTSIISKALGIREYRDGSFRNRGGTSDVQVQHFSLPWGNTCESNPVPIIQNVVLPSVCSRKYAPPVCCREMANVSNVTSSIQIQKRGNRRRCRLKYPGRYFLDIVSSKEWYKSKGVDQVFIIVLRDQNISSKARVKALHCGNEKLLKNEEEVGTDIMIRAINKYILLNDRRKLSMSSYGSWYDESFPRETNNDTDDHNNDRDDANRKLSSSSLPSGNNVVLVSYESLIKLEGIYIKLLYKALDIESDYIPIFKDGNEKYVGLPRNQTPGIILDGK